MPMPTPCHVALADESYRIGPGPAEQSYLDTREILSVAKSSGCQAIHPGYGFLSENAEFAAECEKAGIRFIGPTSEQIKLFGLKHVARELAANAGVPLLPGTALLPDAEAALQAAEQIGFPVWSKARPVEAGSVFNYVGPRTSCGKNLPRSSASARPISNRAEFILKNMSKGRAISKFRFSATARVRFWPSANAIVLSKDETRKLSRKHRHPIFWTPSANVLFEAAVGLGKTVQYTSAGTVEFIYDSVAETFYFLEVNTRLQVEHGVTETVTGIDLVEWMIRLAAGEFPSLVTLNPVCQGHSIQVRIYAEDPNKNFQPSSGLLTEVVFPNDARIDTWIEPGTEVSPHYDPLIAKIIVKGEDRNDALAKMKQALRQTRIYGIETNQSYLESVLENEKVKRGEATTQLLSSFEYQPATLDVIEAGTQTSVQDYPGRLGYWAVGVPPSGPMDALAFRFGNQLLGNPPTAAGLEMTISGPTLRFNTGCTFA